MAPTQRGPATKTVMVLVPCRGPSGGCDGCPHGLAPSHCLHRDWAARERPADPDLLPPPGPVMRLLMRVWGS